MASLSAESKARLAAIDEVAHLTSDISPGASDDLQRLRALLFLTAGNAGARNAALGRAPSHLASVAIGEDLRKSIAGSKPSRKDLRDPPLHVARRDPRDDLLAMRVADGLTALGGAERVGPFAIGNYAIFFDFWREARRYEITVAGDAAPAFVLSSARRALVSLANVTTIDLQKGTVWIRGDLVDQSLPAGAYIGITVSDGKLRLPKVTASTDGGIQIASPIQATLELMLSAEAVAPTEGGCAAGIELDLPVLSLGFGPGGIRIGGSGGGANVWQHDFTFAQPTGTIEFVPQAWTLLLGYTFDPDTFDADLIGSKVASFSCSATVDQAALALPVVLASPAALGPASVSPGFWLKLSAVEARWYAGDERPHELEPWLAISNSTAALIDFEVAPLATPVRTTYHLWELAETDGKRLPWHHGYDVPFLFFYVCDAINGESLIASGHTRVAVDRPLQANGRPTPTPTGMGVVLLRSTPTGVRATLGAAVQGQRDVRLVLRNALVWATQPMWLLAEGALSEGRLIDQGALLLQFGVYAWTPTLPDPYVGNFHVCMPSFDSPRAMIGALVRWNSPADSELTFLGDIGLPVVCPDAPSEGKPRRAPRPGHDPGVGRTQTEQGRIHPSREQLAVIAKAQAGEERLRARRVARANKSNQASQGVIERQLLGRLGRTPPFFLLDVSTNQDLFGVALWGTSARDPIPGTTVAGTGAAATTAAFSMQSLDVTSRVDAMRIFTLPQIQWEPVRTLDEDQDVLTLGWFPTPLASATDGGATILGARSQKLVPAIPEPLLRGTKAVFDEGSDVTFRTTLPFGLVAVVSVTPSEGPGRKADSYDITSPTFPGEAAKGGLQITAKAEGGRDSAGGVSPFFAGMTRQLINGIDLATGMPLGLSVLSSVGDPSGDVETIFNNDMASNPKVPVVRFDLSGYGGSNFSKWENPFALFAETAKTEFNVTVGRTALEIIKVASVLHPWGIKVTRSVIVERRSGGGVIRRDTGWQATSAGLLDYRYSLPNHPAPDPRVADYVFDAGIFKGLFGIRSIRPAPGVEFSNGGATFVPYYFDADLALDGLEGRTAANGILGWLQTAPNGLPASPAALRALILSQGAVGGPLDAWIDFGASKLPFRARRIEMDVADDGGDPLFVACVRGIPKLPKTGAWSVVHRPVAGVAPGGGEAVPISETRGVPIVRRHAVKYVEGDTSAYSAPPLDITVTVGDWRMADPADLLVPANPANDYCLLQSAPTHGFLFPRPHALNSGPTRVLSSQRPELADIIARSTSKGAFPPRGNAITLAAPMHFEVGAGGSLGLSDVVSVVNHPTPLRLAGTPGHGTELNYADATLELELTAEKWRAEFNGVTLWSDIAGLSRASGARMRIVGSTEQRPQVAEIDTLVYEPVEKILSYLPIFGARERLGPIDLGASNAKHEIKLEIATIQEVPKNGFSIGGAEIKLLLGAGGSTGFDLATGGVKASGDLTAGVKAEFPILSVAVAKVYIIVQLDVKFAIASVVGVVTEEKLELIAFAGIGVKGEIGPFKAYAYLGIGFVFVYDFVSDTPKFGGLVRFEAGVDLKIVKIKILAEFKGVVYKKTEALPPPSAGTVEKTFCDYGGKVKVQVDLFMIISISATYSISDTKALE